MARAGIFGTVTPAREEQAEALADQIIGITDKAEDPQIARLQIDARKWVAAKLKPQRYGDKLEVGGKDGGPIVVAWTGDKEER